MAISGGSSVHVLAEKKLDWGCSNINLALMGHRMHKKGNKKTTLLI